MNFKRKISKYGQATAQNNTLEALDWIGRLEILDLSMVFNGGIGTHLMLIKIQTIQVKVLTN